MIIFDYDKYIKDIKKNGIGATDIRANTKINDVMTDLIFNTTYKKGKIIKIVKEIASDFYRGLPEEIIIDKLSTSYDAIKANVKIIKEAEKTCQKYEKKYNDSEDINGKDEKEYEKAKKCIDKYQRITLTLYKSEMETINSLEDDKLQRLAFALLVAFKYHSYHRVLGGDIKYYKTKVDFLADAYSLADFRKVSGTTRNKLLYELTQRGLLYYWKKDNDFYKYQPIDSDRKRWIAFNSMSIPFCVEVKKINAETVCKNYEIIAKQRNLSNDEEIEYLENKKYLDNVSEEVFMQMTNYDDILLYLRYYQGDENVTTCECCGTPILRTGNAKRYCSDCADKMKKASDKARYELKKAV